MNKIFVAMVAAAAAVSLGACGGGGGGGGGSSSSTYTGSKSEATLTGASAVTLSDVLLKNAADNKDFDEMAVSIDDSLSAAASAMGKLTRASGDVYEGCDGRGSVTYTADTTGDGSDYSYTVTFNDFAIWDDSTASGCSTEVVNGAFGWHFWTTTSPSVMHFEYTFDNLRLSAGGVDVARIDGEMGMWFSNDVAGSLGYTMTMETWNRNGDGSVDQFKISGYDVEFANYSQLVSIAGTFYDAEEGYVTVSTTTNFGYSCAGATTPSSGVMVVNDSAGDWTITYGSDTVSVQGPNGETDSAVTDSASGCAPL